MSAGVTTKPPPKSQAELLGAMRRGVVVRHMLGWGEHPSYFYRNDTEKRCTAAINGLFRRGLVEWAGRDEVRAKATEAA